MYYTWNQYFLLWTSMETISPFSYFCMAVRNVCMCAWNKEWSGGEHVQQGFTVPQVGRQSPVACPHWAELFQCSHMVNISKNTHKHAHLHSDTFMHTSTSHTDIHSLPVCLVSPKGDFIPCWIKDPWAQCYKEQQQQKKKRCMRAFNTTHSERITSWETHKAANYFQIFRSRWAKEAETLIPPRVTQSRENSSNSWVCVFFGFDKHSAERCANKYQNQSESTLKNLSNSAETAIKYNFLLTDPPLILQPTVI